MNAKDAAELRDGDRLEWTWKRGAPTIAVYYRSHTALGRLRVDDCELTRHGYGRWYQVTPQSVTRAKGQ